MTTHEEADRKDAETPHPSKKYLSRKIVRQTLSQWGNKFGIIKPFNYLDHSHLFIWQSGLAAKEKTLKDVDLNALPFSDFCYTTHARILAAPNEVLHSRPHAFLVRIMDEGLHLKIGVYMASEKNNYHLRLAFSLEKSTGHAKNSTYLLMKPKDQKAAEADRKLLAQIAGQAIDSLIGFLYLFQNHEVDIDTSPAKKISYGSSVPKKKYDCHFSIDLTRKRKIPLTSEPKPKATHARPICHERIGHMRKYKSGKVVYIKPAMINPDRKEKKPGKTYTI